MKLKFTALGQLLLLIGLAVPQAYSQMCVPPPEGMISWWTGDGTTLDYFGLNDGLTTSPVSYAAGEVADAFSFNGSQFVQVPRSASLEPVQITVDAWVNAAGSPGLTRYIVTKGAVDELEGSYALYTGAAGGLQFYIFDGTLIRFSPAALSPAVWDGNWHHAAGTFDGTAVRLFLDGTEVGTGTPIVTTIAYGLSAGTEVTNDLFIGDFNPNCTSNICLEDHHFIGEVDELEVFERALSQEKIARIFAAGQAGKCLPVKVDVDRSHDGRDWDSEDSVRVAILGSAAFDAADILQPTLRLFPAGDRHHHAGPQSCRLKDVNADTFPDLVCRFHIEEQRHRDDDDDTTVLVTGQVSVTGGQRTFFGADSIDLEPEHGRHGDH